MVPTEKACAAPRFFSTEFAVTRGMELFDGAAAGERLPMKALTPDAVAVIDGCHADPFRYLGPHVDAGRGVVRVFLPDAIEVFAIWADGRETLLDRIHERGLFLGPRPSDATRYQLRVRLRDATVEMEDPYRFPPMLSDLDLHLLGEGNHLQLDDKLGAHPRTLDGVAGIAFAVLAPNARRVSVVGDFNAGTVGVMPCACAAMAFGKSSCPALSAGDKYKFEIVGPDGRLLPLKSDPVAFANELRPRTASIVVDPNEHRAAVGSAARLQCARRPNLDL